MEWTTILAIAGSCSVALVLVAVFVIYCCCCRKKKDNTYSYNRNARRDRKLGIGQEDSVPCVSVQTNAEKLHRFLMKTFSSSSSGATVYYKTGGFGVGIREPSSSKDIYDVILVLDSSGSIGPDEFLKAKQFMADIVNLLPSTISQDNTRIACISYSDADKIKTEFNFLTHTDKNSVIQAIDSITYQKGGSTHTTQALQCAKSLLETTGRAEAQKAIFIATDGHSNGGGDPAIPSNEMKNRNDVKIVVLAVSDNVNVHEVQAIASSPPDDHVYYVNTFTEAAHVTTEVRKNML